MNFKQYSKYYIKIIILVSFILITNIFLPALYANHDYMTIAAESAFTSDDDINVVKLIMSESMQAMVDLYHKGDIGDSFINDNLEHWKNLVIKKKKKIGIEQREHKPLIIKHRVNSKKLLNQAIDLNYDGIEFDVHISKDGVLMLHHDPEVYFEGKKYYTKDLTLEQMRQSFNDEESSDSNQDIMTLEEMFSTPGIERLKFDFHIHNWFSHVEGYNECITNESIRLLKKRHFLENVVAFISFNIDQLLLIKKLVPQAYIVYCVDYDNDKGITALDMDRDNVTGKYRPKYITLTNLIARVRLFKISGIGYPGKKLTKADAQKIKDAGIRVEAGGPPQFIRNLLEIGVGFLCVDDVESTTVILKNFFESPMDTFLKFKLIFKMMLHYPHLIGHDVIRIKALCEAA